MDRNVVNFYWRRKAVMNYTIKRDTKKIAAVVGEGNIAPYHLYQQLKDDYPEISFAIIHDQDPAQVYFNDPNTGKSGFICMSDSYKSLSDLGISKEEFEKVAVNLLEPFEDQKVPVESFEGSFRKFVIGLPEYMEFEHSSFPSGISNPLSSDNCMHVDWDSFDVIINF